VYALLHPPPLPVAVGTGRSEAAKEREKERFRFVNKVLIECVDFHASNKLVNSVLAYRDSEWIRVPVYLLVKGDVVSLSSADEERLPKKILRLLDVDASRMLQLPYRNHNEAVRSPSLPAS
jgi:hypothetical protein